MTKSSQAILPTQMLGLANLLHRQTDRQTDRLTDYLTSYLGNSPKVFPRPKFSSFIGQGFLAVGYFLLIFKSFPVHIDASRECCSFSVGRRGRGLNFQDNFCRVDKAQAVIHFFESNKRRVYDTSLGETNVHEL